VVAMLAGCQRRQLANRATSSATSRPLRPAPVTALPTGGMWAVGADADQVQPAYPNGGPWQLGSVGVVGVLCGILTAASGRQSLQLLG